MAHDIGRNTLKSSRLDLGLTLRMASQLMGVNWKTLQRAEKGLTRPHPRTAKRICDFYRLKPSDVWPVAPREEAINA